MHAQAAWAVHRRAPSEASVRALRWLYPRLVAQQGLGSASLSWTAALLLDALAER